MSLQAIFTDIPDTVQTSAGATLAAATDFEVLALALDATDLVETVATIENATIFAPTDAAFANLAQNLGFEGDPDDAEAVFGAISAALTELAPDDDPVPLLTDILLYHVVPSPETTETLNGTGPIDTALTNTTFQVTNNTIIDNDPDATNADIVAADIAVDGATVQIVDEVLLPFDTPISGAAFNLLQGFEESGGAPDDTSEDFDILLIALQATGLDVALDTDDAELTVLAPTDAAFLSLAQSLGYEGSDEAEALQVLLDASADANPDAPLALLTEVLEYHVLPGLQSEEDILESETLATLNGDEITVENGALVDQDPENVDANFIETDIEATNGIAHVVDQVLLPDTSNDVEEEDDDDDDGGLDGGEIAALFLGVGMFGVFALSGTILLF